MVLPSFQIKIWGKLVKESKSYDRTYKQANGYFYFIYIEKIYRRLAFSLSFYPVRTLSCSTLGASFSGVITRLINKSIKKCLKKNHEKWRLTLHYITLHYITLHYITLHYITCDKNVCYKVSLQSPNIWSLPPPLPVYQLPSWGWYFILEACPRNHPPADLISHDSSQLIYFFTGWLNFFLWDDLVKMSFITKCMTGDQKR